MFQLFNFKPIFDGLLCTRYVAVNKVDMSLARQSVQAGGGNIH